MGLIWRFLREESGATAIEYVMVSAIFSLAVITAVTSIGTKVSSKFVPVGNGLN